MNVKRAEKRLIHALNSDYERVNKMKVVLNENFYMIDDPLQYILVEVHETEKGNLKSTNRYFRTSSDALARFLELSRKDKTKDFDGRIEEYFDAINKANDTTLDTLIMKYEKVVQNGK